MMVFQSNIDFEDWKFVRMKGDDWAWGYQFGGVYAIVSSAYEPLYIGSASHIPARLHQHEIVRKLKREGIDYKIYALPSENRMVIEKLMIGLFNPRFNIAHRTDLGKRTYRVKTLEELIEIRRKDVLKRKHKAHVQKLRQLIAV